MKSKLHAIQASALLASLACGGSAAAAPPSPETNPPKPEEYMAKPEDPVVLPTDEETAKAIKNKRESTLRLLSWDKDGWDDLEVMLIKSKHKDYKFEPDNKTKDTDGDGMSDYEEHLIGRDPAWKEPVYTKAQLIEQVREGRRQAIKAEKQAIINAAKRREELAPFIIAPLTTDDGTPAKAETVEAEGKQKLAALALQNAAADGAKRQRADAFAQRTGFAKHFVDENGKVSSLIDVTDGRPRYYEGHNSTAADTISTDEVRTGGTLGLNLDGTGTTIGLWDGGDVYLPNTEFTSATGVQRITDKDGVSPLGIKFHPTHVAGTMMAKGLNTSAKGMAPAASLSAYDWTGDIAEMTTAASTDALRLSNHSYGISTGWATTVVNGVTRWVWWTDTRVSLLEDFFFGFYSADSRSIDEVAYAAPNYLSVWSAGNERQANTFENGPTAQPVDHYEMNPATGIYNYVTGVTRPVDGQIDLLHDQGVAKNTLVVASVGDITGGYTSSIGVVASLFSSFGPVDDGRIKPDLAANGAGLNSTWNLEANGTTPVTILNGNRYSVISGTSMAAPTVTASLDLLVQHYSNLFGATAAAAFRAATLKALALHTADEAGASLGPDYGYGWGLMNTKTAAALLSLHAASGSSLRNLKQIVLNNGDYAQFTVRATGGAPLKITICWTDPAGTVPANAVDVDVAALVNDLDLRITSGANTFYPWRLNPAAPTAAATRTGDNNRDNVEQVLIDAPVAGQTYTIKVSHKGTLKNASGATAPQAFSMVLSGIQPDPAPDFRCTDISRTGTNIYSVSWTSVVGATYRLQSSTDLLTWTDLTGDFVATKEITTGEVANTASEGRRFWRAKRLP